MLATCARAGGTESQTSITLDVISPPYPCAGTGKLRAVRIGHVDGKWAITAAYDGYQRL